MKLVYDGYESDAQDVFSIHIDFFEAEAPLKGANLDGNSCLYCRFLVYKGERKRFYAIEVLFHCSWTRFLCLCTC